MENYVEYSEIKTDGNGNEYCDEHISKSLKYKICIISCLAFFGLFISAFILAFLTKAVITFVFNVVCILAGLGFLTAVILTIKIRNKLLKSGRYYKNKRN